MKLMKKKLDDDYIVYSLISDEKLYCDLCGKEVMEGEEVFLIVLKYKNAKMINCTRISCTYTGAIIPSTLPKLFNTIPYFEEPFAVPCNVKYTKNEE